MVRGKEVRENSPKTMSAKRRNTYRKRVREVANDRDGIKPFTGPQAEKIKVSCGASHKIGANQIVTPCFVRWNAICC